MNLISSKIARHEDAPKLFARIALGTISLQQLLHYDVTTHCCETLGQALAMLRASDVFPMQPLYVTWRVIIQSSSHSKWMKLRLTHS